MLKKSFRPICFLTAFVLVLLNFGFCSDDKPANMIHVIAQTTGGDIQAGSFAEKPKTYWRASNRYCRIEEEPDPDNNIHGIVVMNEPDAWLVNLADNTAKHMVDPGPTFNCKLPIFAFDLETAKSKIGELEFGHELEFFTANHAELIDGPKLSFKTNTYQLTIENATLVLVERADIHAPIMVGLSRGGKTFQVRYLLWEDQLPFDSKLFATPSGMKIEEVK